ncbi:MAG: preprotein translocase subunit YajC [Planctomycetaceae bacterium]|nr:preprotein translocase subunit YajC [Planctomycetaceae bacterium]
MDKWISTLLLLADDAAPAAKAQEGNPLLQMLIIFAPLAAVWYFLILAPQNKERATRKQTLDNLKKNDSVVTIGGILGTVVNLSEDGQEVTIRVDDNARLKMRRDSIREVVIKEKTDSK